jgi:site-specific DNA-cytosine methylase
VVICLFSGGGGIDHAIEDLFPDSTSHHVESFETDTRCREIISRRGSRRPVFLSQAADQTGAIGSILSLVEDPGKIHSLLSQFPNLKFVIISTGSPCQGFSQANPKAKGILDHRSCLAAAIPIIIKQIYDFKRSQVHHLQIFSICENVMLRSRDKLIMNRLLGSEPIQINNGDISCQDRNRMYWLNFQIDQPDPVEIDPSSILEPGWAPLWELIESKEIRRKFITQVRPFPPDLPEECPVSWWRFPLSSYAIRGLVYNKRSDKIEEIKRRVREGIELSPSQDLRDRNRGQDAIRRRLALAHWIHREGGYHHLRPLSIRESSRAMGYDPESFILPADQPESPEDPFIYAQFNVIGNAFALQSMRHILTRLSGAFGSNQALPIEQDLSNLPTSQEEILGILRSSYSKADR